MKLFDIGCNPKPKNGEGLTPKQIAIEERSRDALKSIRKAELFYHEMNANLPTGTFICLKTSSYTNFNIFFR